MSRDLGIANRLRAVGLTVIEVDGWQTRGSYTFEPRGSVNHHTAGPLNGDHPSLGICINGRSGLPGPLCNVFQARSNVIYVVAAGRANHAGIGGVRGLSGNSSVYGLEVENTGYNHNDPWSEGALLTMAQVHRALGVDPELVVQHHEWTTRKIDAHDVDGNWFRDLIRYIAGTPAPAPIPPPDNGPVSEWPRNGRMLWPLISTATKNAKPVHTSIIQQVTGSGVDGWFGTGTKAAVIAYQRAHRQVADGAVGPATGTVIVQNVLRDLGVANLALDGQYGPATSVAVAKLQAFSGLTIDGHCGDRTTDALWFFTPK